MKWPLDWIITLLLRRSMAPVTLGVHQGSVLGHLGVKHVCLIHKHNDRHQCMWTALHVKKRNVLFFINQVLDILKHPPATSPLQNSLGFLPTNIKLAARNLDVSVDSYLFFDIQITRLLSNHTSSSWGEFQKSDPSTLTLTLRKSDMHLCHPCIQG